MERDKYYSLTDIKKKFKIGSDDFRLLLTQHNIPSIEKKIDHGTYSTNAIYTLRTDIDKLLLKK